MTMMPYQNKDQWVFKATADDISNNQESTTNTRINKKKLEEKRLQVYMASIISRIIEKEPEADLLLTVIKQEHDIESASIAPAATSNVATHNDAIPKQGSVGQNCKNRGSDQYGIIDLSHF